jgi:lipopolysaccharide biosynthesis glycosyltransferase
MVAFIHGLIPYKANCYTSDEITDAKNRPLIVHYIAGNKPWTARKSAEAERWWKYRNMIPNLQPNNVF